MIESEFQELKKKTNQFLFKGEVTNERVNRIELELSFPNHETIIEKIEFEDELKVMRITCGILPIADVITNTQMDIVLFDDDIMEERELNLYPIACKAEEFTTNKYLLGNKFVSTNLWQCACKKNFIHSRLLNACPFCETKQKDEVFQLPQIWEFFKIGEEKE